MTFDPTWVNPRSGNRWSPPVSPLLRRLLPASAFAMALAVALPGGQAYAAEPAVGLGTAAPYAVLAGTTVTNTGPSTISGSVGVAPGSAVDGFPPGQVGNGTIHAADAQALQAQNDLTTAFNDAAGRGPGTDETGKNLGGQTLTPGVYTASTSMNLTGTVTLNALGDPAAVFIFQAGSTLLAASSSRVALIGAAQPCNVFWQVGSSATIGTGSTFVGTVMALTTITLQTGATVQGRMLARNGAVTLDTNTFIRPACDLTVPTTAPSPTATPEDEAWEATESNPGDDDSSDNPGDGSDDGSGDGGGGGTSGPGGPVGTPGAPTGPPVIPPGHPETGRPADAPVPSDAWLALGLVCVLGAGAAAWRGRMARATPPRP